MFTPHAFLPQHYRKPANRRCFFLNSSVRTNWRVKFVGQSLSDEHTRDLVMARFPFSLLLPVLSSSHFLSCRCGAGSATLKAHPPDPSCSMPDTQPRLTDAWRLTLALMSGSSSPALVHRTPSMPRPSAPEPHYSWLLPLQARLHRGEYQPIKHQSCLHAIDQILELIGWKTSTGKF
jgi:hypothetical protein